MAKRIPPAAQLSSDDKRLWKQVAETLDHHKPLSFQTDDSPHSPAPTPKPKPNVVTRPSSTGPRSLPLASLSPRERNRIHRQDRVEARLDLHGMTEAEAHAAVRHFVITCQAQGLRQLLIITGKGRGGDGVLRRAVPRWLEDPSLRSAVLGYAEAGRRHGGAGALYVQLRRRKRPGGP